MVRDLTRLEIPCTLILDSAMGYVMEQVDMVMVGAEGVAESGGIINKVIRISNQFEFNSVARNSYDFLFQVGTYTMAMSAREVKKPFYVLTESYKFSRIYPLNQVDLPNEFKASYDCFELLK